MTVDDWVLEAVQELSPKGGATLREVQRYIDEHHYEELAVDTLETSLVRLTEAGKLQEQQGRWLALKKTSKEDALKKLFKDS
jgi:hypothetical protein